MHWKVQGEVEHLVKLPSEHLPLGMFTYIPVVKGPLGLFLSWLENTVVLQMNCKRKMEKISLGDECFLCECLDWWGGGSSEYSHWSFRASQVPCIWKFLPATSHWEETLRKPWKELNELQSSLAWKCIRVHLKELESVTWKSMFYVSLLNLLLPLPNLEYRIQNNNFRLN